MTDELFEKQGVGKTRVADVARELGMSPANIFKHFASKDELVQAVVKENHGRIRKKVEEIARSEGTVRERLEEMAVAVFRFYRERLRNEEKIYQLVAQAYEEGWESVKEFHAYLLSTLTRLLREGAARGEIRTKRAAALAEPLMDALYVAFFPHQRLSWTPAETEARVRAQIKLILAGLP